MRQIGDLAVWIGMIGLAVGVVHYAPIVADYLTADADSAAVAVVAGARKHSATLHPPGPPGEWRVAR